MSQDVPDGIVVGGAVIHAGDRVVYWKFDGKEVCTQMALGDVLSVLLVSADGFIVSANENEGWPV